MSAVGRLFKCRPVGCRLSAEGLRSRSAVARAAKPNSCSVTRAAAMRNEDTTATAEHRNWSVPEFSRPRSTTHARDERKVSARTAGLGALKCPAPSRPGIRSGPRPPGSSTRVSEDRHRNPAPGRTDPVRPAPGVDPSDRPDTPHPWGARQCAASTDASPYAQATRNAGVTDVRPRSPPAHTAIQRRKTPSSSSRNHQIRNVHRAEEEQSTGRSHLGLYGVET